MISKVNFGLVLAVVATFYVQEGLSIKCYTCNSKMDPRCADPFNNSTIAAVDCAQEFPNKNATFCRKQVQKASLNGITDYRIVRGCGWEGDKKESALDVKEDDIQVASADGSSCFNRAGTFEVMVTYCKCVHELCNGVEAQAPSVLAMTMVVLASTTVLFTSRLLV